MIGFKIKDLHIVASSKNITIFDSYKIKDRKEMEAILLETFKKAPMYHRKRSMKSLIREWVCHNRLYELGLFESHTKDCDFEANEALHRRFFYFFLGR